MREQREDDHTERACDDYHHHHHDPSDNHADDHIADDPCGNHHERDTYPKEWNDKYKADLALVIATTNGLINAINSGNAAKIKTACDALRNIYRAKLQPVTTAPEAKVDSILEEAENAIYTARGDCHEGIIGKAKPASAAAYARTGVDRLNQVFSAAGIKLGLGLRALGWRCRQTVSANTKGPATFR